MKTSTKLLLLLAAACLVRTGQAQDWEWNFGLHNKQSQLPISKAPKAQAERKARIEIPGALTPAGDNEYLISEGWSMIEAERTVSQPILDPKCDLSAWYNATVPGTVLTTLVDQGVYPDPYVGLNNLLIPDTLSRMDWWYRVTFDNPQAGNAAAPERARLLFNGINYKAQVWLNGQKLGNIAGAFTRGSFDVGGLLRDKDNVLAVHILPVNNPGIPHEQIVEEQGPNGGLLCLDGPTFIATEGWDWMPGIRDRSIGIWQDVRLCFSGDVTLEDPQVITDLPLPDTTRADISVRTVVRNRSDRPQTTTLTGEIGDIRFEKSIQLAPQARAEVSFTPDEFPQLRMADPALWWPNGYGAQPLYTLRLTASTPEGASDTQEIRFGIREMSYEFMVDGAEQEGLRIGYSPTDIADKRPLFCYDHEKMRRMTALNPDVQIPILREGVDLTQFAKCEKSDNPYLVIGVNGVSIFCKGGDWGMDDAMKRCSREQLEPYFRLHADEHFNMVRNWQGQCTEEAFYELCDEYGMLVWNDFSMSTGWYSLRPHDFRLFLDNATDVVKRFVNHPSIALWCCGNETYAPAWLEERFQTLIAEQDGTRHYHGNSRYINMTTSGPWRYIRDFTEYYRTLAYGFNTELGAPSVPTYETVCKFIPEEDLWPIDDVWAYHDALVNGWVGWPEYCEDIDALGQAPCRNAQEFCDRAQILNYNLHRVMFEAWNDKMWESTSGVLYWMSHPAWYSVVQQTYSWDYKTFGTFYGCRKACEPVHIQWNLNDHRVQAVNASQQQFANCRASFEVYAPSGRLLFEKHRKTDLASNIKADLFTQALPASGEKLVLVRLRLTDAAGKTLSRNDYWCNEAYVNAPAGLYDLPAASLCVRIVREGAPERFVAEVKNTGKHIAPYVEMNAADPATGKSILPAYVEDSYFNLLPGESRRIAFELPAGTGAAEVTARALNARGACPYR